MLDEEARERLGLQAPPPKRPTPAEVAKAMGLDDEELEAWRGRRSLPQAETAEREIAEMRRLRQEPEDRRVRERVQKRERRG